MTLEDINYIAQTIGVIAILVSLIFVGMQVRQNSAQIEANTRSIKAAAGLDATYAWATFNEQLFLSDESIMVLIRRSFDPQNTWDDFTETERIRMSMGQRALFQKLEGLYFLHRYGSLDTSIWESRLQWAAGTIRLPFWAQWWAVEKTQSIYTSEFVVLVDAAHATATVQPWNPDGIRGGAAALDRPQDGMAP